MTQAIASAVFDSRDEATRAVSELRNAGIRDNAISVIARDEGKTTTHDGGGDEVNKSGALKGALGGAAAGGLLGLAALAIPGVGPLAAAGAIAASAMPEAAALGAVAGGTLGGLSGLLTKHGVSKEDASYYEGRINEGATFVSIDTADAGLSYDQAQDLLHRYGGHTATRSRTEAL
jgi:hypothetical protein